MESRMLVEKEANHGAQELNLNLQYGRLINHLEAMLRTSYSEAHPCE